MEICYIVAIQESNSFLLLDGQGSSKHHIYTSNGFNNTLDSLWDKNGSFLFYENIYHPMLSHMPIIAFSFYPDSLENVNEILGKYYLTE